MSEPVEVKLGSETVTLVVPSSLWVRESVRLALGEADTMQTKVQVAAAALMLCAATSKKPRYRNDVQRYGAECMEFLIRAGVPKQQIMAAGMVAINLVDESIPSEEDVEDARGNLPGTEGPSSGQSYSSAGSTVPT